MKLQDIKSKKPIVEQQPGSGFNIYSPSMIKNALKQLNWQATMLKKRLIKLKKAQETNPQEWEKNDYDKVYATYQAQLKALQDKIYYLKAQDRIVYDERAVEDFWLVLKRECSDYLAACGQTQKWLYRGIKNEHRPAFLAKTRENRAPMDSNPVLMKCFDQALENLGFNARRENSIFAISDRDKSLGFGDVFVIFPRNGFDFTYTNEREIILDELDQVLSTKYIQTWMQAVKKAITSQSDRWPVLPPTATPEQMYSIIQQNRESLLSQGFPPNLVDDISDPQYISQKYQPQQTNLHVALTVGQEVYVRGEYYALRWKWYRESIYSWMYEIQKTPISEQQQTATNNGSTILAIPTELDQWNTLDKDMHLKIHTLTKQNDIQQLEKVQKHQLRLQNRMSWPDLDIMPLTQRAWEEIQQRCSNILSIMRETNEYLWHGSKQLQASTYVMTSPTNRLPKDSSQTTSKVFNYALEQLGFQARRDNSLFVTSKRWLAKDVGPTYIILPWDNQCDFTYTNEVDLVLDSVNWYGMYDDNQVMMLWQKWKQIPDETKNELIVWKGALQDPGDLFRWLIEHEHNAQTLKKLQQATGMSTRWQDYVDLPQFQRQFQPSKTDLKSAMERYVEIYLSGKFYALRADPAKLEANWWKILATNTR
tara:strand:- start:2377 stop:4326 length:1950 start_codon:yes stop_codon:yes gene_type:complete